MSGWDQVEARIRAWPFDTLRGGGDQTLEGVTMIARPPLGASLSSRQALLPTIAVSEQEDADLRLETLLGQGGMGKVWAAEQRALGRQVAVKVPHTVEGVEASVLVREATVLGSLEHPGVVPLYLLGRAGDGMPLMVMRKIEGTPWTKIIHDPQHPYIQRAGVDAMSFHLQVASRVCDALELAHSRQVLHRDIKPDNVMLGRFGEVYLVDWGIAVTLEEAQRGGTELTGTPNFMAPEMAVGELKELSVRTDVYLVGSTLYFALLRRPRHAGDELMKVLLAAARSEPPVFDDSIPRELASILAKATHADPAERHASVAELRAELAAFQVHRGSIELARAAELRAAELKALVPAASKDVKLAREAASKLAEAQFGFLAALRDWPQNTSARAALDDALADMIRIDLAHDNLDQADRWLAMISAPRPELGDAIMSAKWRRAAKDEETEGLKRSHAELDLARHARERRWVFGLLAVITATITGLTLFDAARGKPITHADLLVYCAGVLFALAGATIGLRRTLLATQINRRVMGLAWALMLGDGLNRVFGWLRDASVDELMIYEFLQGTVVAMIAALAVHRSFAWMSVVMLAGFFAAHAAPAWILPIYGISTSFALFSIALILGPSTAPKAAAP